uniref:SUN domain-containing protein n=1 Tax=Knipowitschia caucasica TaxID=637954 RepID=A0AAV2KLV6_KNICA
MTMDTDGDVQQLQDQVNYLQQLEEEVDHLHQHLEQHKAMVRAPLANFALEIHGARVMTAETSKTHEQKNGPPWLKPLGPDTVFKGHNYPLIPGQCWAFTGQTGRLSIALPLEIHITKVTVGHILKEQSLTRTIQSAPKSFSVYGLKDFGPTEVRLGTFLYDADGDSFQTFDILEQQGTLKLPVVPADLSCTEELQTWHRPRTQGIKPEAVSEMIVSKPRLKKATKAVVKSTLYPAHSGPLPDQHLMTIGEKLKHIQPQLGICKILSGLEEMTMVDSKFGLVPHGSVLSYQYPAKDTGGYVKDLGAPDFPSLPVEGYSFKSDHVFVPTYAQSVHMESLQFVRDPRKSWPWISPSGSETPLVPQYANPNANEANEWMDLQYLTR